jgi:hypothetical protein
MSTPAEKLLELVQQELEVREKRRSGEMPFRDYMEHIRVSHDKLLDILSGNEKNSGLPETELEVEVIYNSEGRPSSQTAIISSDVPLRVIDNPGTDPGPTLATFRFEAPLRGFVRLVIDARISEYRPEPAVQAFSAPNDRHMIAKLIESHFYCPVG